MQSAGHILIVDDQLSAREVLRGLLSGKGYQLVFASGGQEALIKASAQLPDLVLLDVMMPGMDGFEVCRRLRNDPALAGLPIIMVTSLDDQEARLRGLELGVDDFLSKPFNPTELQLRVQTITRLNRQRRQHLLELQAERDRTQAILEALGEAVIVTDAAGVVEYLNPAAAALTGFSPSEAKGQSWRLGQNGESGAQPYEEILAVVQKGQTWRGEMVHQRQDGTLYDTAMTVAPLFELDQPGQPSGFVSVQRDITPLKKAERAKDEFVSNVSHELRTPLSILTLVSDNLDLLYERLDEQKRRKMIRDIQKQTQILNELIGDILEVSRLDSGRVSMEREALNLNELAQLEVKEMSPLAQQKQQNFSLSGAEPLKVWGHKIQLQQVIRNLLNNAIKYTPEGGQIYCECHRLSVPSALADPTRDTAWPGLANLSYQPWAALRVRDTGIGISPENLPYVFERFYRVKAQDNVRGTGLGLSIVRKLVELHDGQVAVSSTPGQGSVFAIYLPVLE
ncbi:MAG: response regulator [Anaerolineae bacterium]|nr:response regulator [Anaerolineae bacterium]